MHSSRSHLILERDLVFNVTLFRPRTFVMLKSTKVHYCEIYGPEQLIEINAHNHLVVKNQDHFMDTINYMNPPISMLYFIAGLIVDVPKCQYAHLNNPSCLL